jgi:hypothetical protein
MKMSSKAALYSALIFPGAGLCWLKQYWQAALFILPSLAICAYVVRATLATAQLLRDKIADGSLALDISTLSLAVERSIEQLTSSLNNLIWLLILCWAASIVCSYLAGERLDRPTK